MTDVEYCMHYIEKCSAFVNPLLLGELDRRGLVWSVNFLSGDIQERKAQCYARLSQAKKVFGDPEIDKIAGLVENSKRLQRELCAIANTDVEKRIPLLEQMLRTETEIKNYFKK